MEFNVTIDGQNYKVVAKVENPSEDFKTGFLCGFVDCIGRGSFERLVERQIKNKRVFFHNGSAEGLVKVFDETAEEILCLVQLSDDITIAVEKLKEFVEGIASAQKAVFFEFHRKGYENDLSPASWIRLKYLSLSLCDGEVYEEMFDDGFIVGEKINIPNTVEVSFE